ncbi:MAG: Gfo/Idh/MocA family oxidoreductase, partial [Flavobacteriales bacterium]|nr:Gfo/Idh/MocA family oxidoreductase [Flavobacteriales bacterium]
IKQLTAGHGVDSVLICAGTKSNDPVELAGEIARKKGIIVMVGASSTNFSRPNYFKKELELKMSASYGPGRYDTNYEELGNDYPYAYVRWTENRNMQAFLDLVEKKKLNLDHLITHEYEFKDAKKAYDLIVNDSENPCGITLKYDIGKSILSSTTRKIVNNGESEIKIGLIGAGNFAQNFLLPNIKGKADLIGLSTNSPSSAKNVGDKYQIPNLYSNATDIVQNKEINTVFVLTRHNTHAQFVIAALQNDKHVYVEKPLCLTEKELNAITKAHELSKGSLVVGFNRRFSSLSAAVKKKLNGTPIAINYRINSGIVDSSHWTQNPKIGGGRIIGEVCHFVDYCSFLAGSSVTTVSALAMETQKNTNDTITINLSFQNGSVASIAYYSNGNAGKSKEFIEIFSQGVIHTINDFNSLTSHGEKVKKNKLSGQNKGYAMEMELYFEGIKKGTPLLAFDSIYNSSLATLKIVESIQNGGKLIKL